jgi:hypothetical protein
MRKVSWGGAVAGVALIVTGVAVAHGGSSKSITRVGGTFTATTVSDAKTTTCTNAAGTWSRVDATYTGTATGDSGSPDLTGPAKLAVRAVINTTTNLGVVTGTLRIDTAGGNTKADFSTVYDNGKVVGLAVGRAHDPSARLYANISATYSPTSGFNGKIGGPADGGSAVELVSGDCQQQATQKATLSIEGSVVSASATSLVVKSGSDQVTCAVSTAQAADVAKLAVGQSVKAKCSLANGSYQLVSLSGSGEHKDRDRK